MVFLKTHKTGSSTITNILSRYGDRNNLIFVLPKENQNRLGWPWSLQLDHVTLYSNSTYNILSSHSRYNRAVLEKLMPNDTVYVTILRDPVTQFESTFSYMGFGHLLGLANDSDPLTTFFENPKETLINYMLTQDLRIHSDRLKLIRNGMFFDLGLEPKDFEDDAKINQTIKKLDGEFHLVMLMEQFDESLVLLKRLLCWETNDILSFQLNERKQKQKRTHFTDDLVRKIRSWSKADVQLYNYFQQSFYSLLAKQDENFNEEVRDLQFRNYFMRHTCLEELDMKTEGILNADVRKYVIRQNITSALRRTCDRMLWDEVKYLRFLKRKQDDMLIGNNRSWLGRLPGYGWISSLFH